jgi:hypothetical protein
MGLAIPILPYSKSLIDLPNPKWLLGLADRKKRTVVKCIAQRHSTVRHGSIVQSEYGKVLKKVRKNQTMKETSKQTNKKQRMKVRNKERK